MGAPLGGSVALGSLNHFLQMWGEPQSPQQEAAFPQKVTVEKRGGGTSLVLQNVGLRLSMHATRVQSLVQEDPLATGQLSP